MFRRKKWASGEEGLHKLKLKEVQIAERRKQEIAYVKKKEILKRKVGLKRYKKRITRPSMTETALSIGGDFLGVPRHRPIHIKKPIRKKKRKRRQRYDEYSLF